MLLHQTQDTALCAAPVELILKSPDVVLMLKEAGQIHSLKHHLQFTV